MLLETALGTDVEYLNLYRYTFAFVLATCLSSPSIYNYNSQHDFAVK